MSEISDLIWTIDDISVDKTSENDIDNNDDNEDDIKNWCSFTVLNEIMRKIIMTMNDDNWNNISDDNDGEINGDNSDGNNINVQVADLI